jgi:hypothetical protein
MTSAHALVIGIPHVVGFIPSGNRWPTRPKQYPFRPGTYLISPETGGQVVGLEEWESRKQKNPNTTPERSDQANHATSKAALTEQETIAARCWMHS